MAENNQLPKFKSLDELTDFFDRNDMSDYWEQMPEVEFEIDLKRRSFFVEVDEDLAGKLKEISEREHQPSEKIVNSWLREKISSYSEKV